MPALIFSGTGAEEAAEAKPSAGPFAARTHGIVFGQSACLFRAVGGNRQRGTEVKRIKGSEAADVTRLYIRLLLGNGTAAGRDESDIRDGYRAEDFRQRRQ